MIKAKLNDFFNPKALAVIGASSEPGKIGYEILKNIITGGFKGEIYPINPKGGEILGIKVFKSILDVPITPELAIICTPAKVVPKVIEECGIKGVRGVVIITAGFSEIGNYELERKIVSIANNYGLRIIGPNSAGIINEEANLHACLEYRVSRGPISLISQSGAMGGVLFAYARAFNIGFNKFISCGNSCDVDEVEALEFLGKDPKTKVIALYIESVKRGRDLIKIARGIVKEKPIIALKAGKSTAGIRAAQSHTGKITTTHAIYSAAFKQAGIIQVNTIEELFFASKALVMLPIPKGNNIAIVTNSGGPAVLTTDQCEEIELNVPEPSQKLISKLRVFLPNYCSVRNPIDLTAIANYDLYYKTLKAILNSHEFDCIIVIFVPPSFGNSTEIAKAIVDAYSQNPNKPLITCFLYGDVVEDGIKILERNKILNISSTEITAKVMKVLVEYGKIKFGG